MEKKNWISFLNAKLRSQISLETVERAQTWGFALLALWLFGVGFNAVGEMKGRTFLFETKVLFLILTHIVILLAFYLPALFEKGRKPVSRLLAIHSFAALIFNGMMLVLTAVIVSMLSQQIFTSGKEAEAGNFFLFIAGANSLMALLYLIAGVFYFASLALFPNLLNRILERSGKAVYVLFGFHVALAILLGMSYSNAVGIGSQTFFEEFRVAGIFWIALLSSLFFIGHALKESSVPALSDLELEIASGRLEKHEDILERYQEAFVSKRLWAWLNRIAHASISKAQDIADHLHEAVSIVGLKKPSETDLRKVEEHYKKADQIYRKFEKAGQRFQICSASFEVMEAERQRIEEITDQFSRDLRNAKLELAGVRKRIDEKLISLKNSSAQSPAEIPVEKVPVSR